MKKVVGYVPIAVLLIVSLSVFAFYGSRKRISYNDEIYSLTISNAHRSFLQFVDGEWSSGDEVELSFIHDDSDSVEMVINNVRFDKVHPPLYYLAMYGMFTLFEKCGLGSDYLKISLLLNSFFYIGIIICTYILLKKMFHNEIYACVGGMFIAFNPGILSAAMFIRMYIMMTFFCVLFVLLNYIIHENPKKYYIYPLLCIVTVLGFLTQYYFALFAVGCYCVEMIYGIVKRKWGHMIYFSLSMLMSVVISTIFWREWKNDLLGNTHSGPMKDKLYSIQSTFFANLYQSFINMASTAFKSYYLPGVVIFLILVIIAITFIVLKKDNNLILFCSVQLAFAAVFSAVVITELAPDYLLSNRYYYAPSSQMILAMLITAFFVFSRFNLKYVAYAIVAISVITNVYVINKYNLDYCDDYKAYDNFESVLEAYAHIPWIVSGDEGWIMRGVMQFFTIPDKLINIVNLDDKTEDEYLKSVDEIILFGADDNVKMSEAGLNYYIMSTGGGGTEVTELGVWKSMHAYLVRRDK